MHWEGAESAVVGLEHTEGDGDARGEAKMPVPLWAENTESLDSSHLSDARGNPMSGVFNDKLMNQKYHDWENFIETDVTLS